MPISNFERKYIYKIKEPLRWDSLTMLPCWFHWLFEELLNLFPFDLDAFAWFFSRIHRRSEGQIRDGLQQVLELHDVLQLNTFQSFSDILCVVSGRIKEPSKKERISSQLYREIFQIIILKKKLIG